MNMQPSPPDFTDIALVKVPRYKVVNGKLKHVGYLQYTVMRASADWLKRFEAARK